MSLCNACSEADAVAELRHKSKGFAGLCEDCFSDLVEMHVRLASTEMLLRELWGRISSSIPDTVETEPNAGGSRARDAWECETCRHAQHNGPCYAIVSAGTHLFRCPCAAGQCKNS